PPGGGAARPGPRRRSPRSAPPPPHYRNRSGLAAFDPDATRRLPLTIVVDAKGKPLGLYVFGHDRRAVNTVIRRTSSGGVSVNELALHALSDSARLSADAVPPWRGDRPRNAMLRMSGLRRPRTCPRADRGRDDRVRLAVPEPPGRLQP
ncbi:hypothetical protein, partial [Streptomyces sp. NPDC005827]|uniref:hypothetical protein n=1 Tax=Streptomyces sp. NPDC005827 TaxID=3157070 RepID=UPI003409B02B